MNKAPQTTPHIVRQGVPDLCPNSSGYSALTHSVATTIHTAPASGYTAKMFFFAPLKKSQIGQNMLIFSFQDLNLLQFGFILFGYL